MSKMPSRGLERQTWTADATAASKVRSASSGRVPGGQGLRRLVADACVSSSGASGKLMLGFSSPVLAAGDASEALSELTVIFSEIMGLCSDVLATGWNDVSCSAHNESLMASFPALLGSNSRI